MKKSPLIYSAESIQDFQQHGKDVGREDCFCYLDNSSGKYTEDKANLAIGDMWKLPSLILTNSPEALQNKGIDFLWGWHNGFGELISASLERKLLDPSQAEWWTMTDL